MEGFTFWRSYYETMKKADAETVKSLLVAMGEFMFDGEEPELEGVAALLFEAFRGNLATSKARSEAGRRGGTANKQNEANASKPEALKTKNKKQKTKNKTLNTKNEKQNTIHEDKDEDEKQGLNTNNEDEDEEQSCDGPPVLSVLSGEVSGLCQPLETYKPPCAAEWNRLRNEKARLLEVMRE